MMRTGMVGRVYYRNTTPIRTYQISTAASILTPSNVEDAQCKLIQSKKDELLISLTKYFSKEIEKAQLSTNLTKIKQDLAKNCPSYVARVGCC
jgi:hypothetical protein